MFPGLISLAIMLIAVSGLTLFSGAADWMEVGRWSWRDIPIQLILAWNAISTIAAWGVYRLDKAGAPKWLRNFFLVLIGYGPLMCSITFAAMVAQFRNADMRWDKTMKSGKAKILR